MKYALILVLVTLGLVYFFRDDVAPGWLGPHRQNTATIPSSLGSLGRSVGQSFGRAADPF